MASKIKKEKQDSRDASSSSGLQLQGPPTNPDPGILGLNPDVDRDSNEEMDESVPRAREHLPDTGEDDED
eukprot:10452342-Karenia_brevis.AAC.1